MAEAGGVQLIPGTPITPTFPLARYRSHHLSGVVRAIAESSTKPGDLILAIGTTAGTPVTEAVSAGRRMVGLDRNPIHLLWAHLDLAPVPLDRVETALTQLGDLPKEGRPLIAYINGLYATRCPECGQQGTAEWFAWDRDVGKPYAKRVRCRHCDGPQEGPVDSEDLVAAGAFPVRAGPTYHLALSRAVTPDDPDHQRVAELVQLYTARNLSALMNVINRMPQLHLPPDVQRVVTALILEALDRGSSLASVAAPDEHPRSLRPPQRFLETNVWMILEQAINAYGTSVAAPPVAEAATPSLSGLLARPTPGYLLLDASIQDLDPSQIARSVAAVVFEVRPPEATPWALSMLWASWLWRDSLAHGLRGFLSRRRLDWDWYRRSLAAALHHLTPLLQDGAPIVMVAPADGPSSVRAILHAATQADLHVDRWIACTPLGYRVVLRGPRQDAASGRQTRLPFPIPLSSTRARPETYTVEEVAERILSHRGEPTDRHELTAMAVLESGEPDLPALSTDDAPAFVALADHYVWLGRAQRAEAPLGDRLEEEILRMLTDQRRWRREHLEAEIYAVFEGVVSPEPDLIAACIEAYTTDDGTGHLSLRPEDEPDRRKAEAQQMRAEVHALGERLNYGVGRRLGGDIVWKEGSTQPFLFRCTTTAVLGPHLLKSPPPCDGPRCLIIPGGRAALTALKLRRDPRLSELARTHEWAFIKFRHLRRMVEEIHERSDIEVYLGLDPIVERESAQLTLPLDMAAKR